MGKTETILGKIGNHSLQSFVDEKVIAHIRVLVIDTSNKLYTPTLTLTSEGPKQQIFSVLFVLLYEQMKDREQSNTPNFW